MFKIARTVQQIFNTARNVPKSLLSSINNIFKYSSGSKGYVEDASDEFTFTKVLPDSTLIQDRLKVSSPNSLNIAKVKHVQLLDSAETCKLIYARFADEIAAKPKNVADTRSHEMKEYVGDVVAKYNIADEFKALREQGYDFASAKKAVQNQNNSKTLSQRMKELVISGYISRYLGESGLKEEVEELMDKHVLVIKEFMQKVNDAAVSDICEADLLGEY